MLSIGIRTLTAITQLSSKAHLNVATEFEASD